MAVYRWADANRSAVIELIVESDGTEISRRIPRVSAEFRALDPASILPAARWPGVGHARADLAGLVMAEATQRINETVVNAFRSAGRGIGAIESARATLLERGQEPWAQAAATHIRAVEDARDAHLAAIAAVQTLAEAEAYNLDLGWPS